jgi:hypothetical protein
MKEKEVEKQLNILQREIAINGEELEALRRDQRAAMDTLRLEVEMLRRCLIRLYPDFKKCMVTLRDEAAQEINPEAL